MIPEFKGFPKIARLSRDIIITEKIDGTNGIIYIDDENNVFAGNRNKWITPEDDNYGFAKWVYDNREELLQLGPGYHYGEWYGLGINRGYGLSEKRFALFNVHRWSEDRPVCCDVVPILYQGQFETFIIYSVLVDLSFNGSRIAPGFLNPEEIVIYHTASNTMFKKTIVGDDKPKGLREDTK